MADTLRESFRLLLRDYLADGRPELLDEITDTALGHADDVAADLRDRLAAVGDVLRRYGTAGDVGALAERVRAVFRGEPDPGLRPRRYDQCDDWCTPDCGHCKGAGRPEVAP